MGTSLPIRMEAHAGCRMAALLLLSDVCTKASPRDNQIPSGSALLQPKGSFVLMKFMTTSLFYKLLPFPQTMTYFPNHTKHCFWLPQEKNTWKSQELKGIQNQNTEAKTFLFKVIPHAEARNCSSGSRRPYALGRCSLVKCSFFRGTSLGIHSCNGIVMVRRPEGPVEMEGSSVGWPLGAAAPFQPVGPQEPQANQGESAFRTQGLSQWAPSARWAVCSGSLHVALRTRPMLFCDALHQSQLFSFYKEKGLSHKADLRYRYYRDYPMRINAVCKIWNYVCFFSVYKAVAWTVIPSAAPNLLLTSQLRFSLVLLGALKLKPKEPIHLQ